MMFKSLWFFALTAMVGVGLTLAMVPRSSAQRQASPDGVGAFEKIAGVLQSPRCLNCHPAGESPLNGDDNHPHIMMIARGPDDMGAPGARCTACHRDENSKISNVPGAPEWAVAPKSMSWQGLTHAELCHALLDRKKNGDRDVAALVEHMNTPLVKWGWNPGGNRAPVSIPHEEFMGLMKVWEAAGAPCPA